MDSRITNQQATLGGEGGAMPSGSTCSASLKHNIDWNNEGLMMTPLSLYSTSEAVCSVFLHEEPLEGYLSGYTQTEAGPSACSATL